MNKSNVILTGFLIFAILFLASQKVVADQFQCATGQNRAKTDSSISADYDELHLGAGQIITAVYVKAGTACIVPDGTCYAITDGGVGYNFVVVERVGNPGPECQAISHIEVEYAVESTPTSDPSETPTENFTQTPVVPTETPVVFTQTPESPTDTPEPSITPTSTTVPSMTPTPFSGTPTPWSPPCTNPGGCTGSG